MRKILVALSCGALLGACGGGQSSSPPSSLLLPAPGTSVSTTVPVSSSAPEADAPDAAVQAIASDLQVDLIGLKLSPGPVNGQFDSTTEAALVSFQKHSGIPASEQGSIGPATAAALSTAIPTGQPLDVVAALQSALTDVGAFHDLITGQYNTVTDAAVKRVQAFTGMNITGFYSPQTANVLASVYLQQVKEPAAPTVAPATAVTFPAGRAATAIVDLQQSLVRLGYRPGPDQGLLDSSTVGALLAFQKRQGLPPNGVPTAPTLSDLDHPTGAGPQPSGAAPRIEVDLARQLLFVELPGQPLITLNASSGSELAYTVAGGHTDVAYTPVGNFSIIRKQPGEVAAPIGSLYDPLYFDGGWAIEGAASVPAFRASYGCIRISYLDAAWLFPLIAVGTPVVVYGSSGAAPADAAPGY